MSSSNRYPLAILFVTIMLLMVSFGIIIPNLAYRAAELGASEWEVGLLMATYALFQFVFAPLWGRFSDSRGRRPVILVGLGGNAIGLLVFGLGESLWVLFAARAVAGIGTAAVLPSCLAYVADRTDEKGRGAGMGWMGAAMGLGFIFGPPVGGALGAHGHHLPFLLAAAVTGLALVFTALLLPETRPQPSDTARTWFPSLGRTLGGPLVAYFAVAFFTTLTMSGLETTFPFLVQEVLGIGASTLGWMLGLMGLAAVVVRGGLLGRLIRRFGDETVLMAGLLINAAGFFFIASASSLSTMTLYLTVAGVGNLILQPTNASLISKRTRTGHGEAMGALGSMDALGRVVGPFAAGAIYVVHPSAPYYFGALVLSLVFVAMGVLRRPPEA